MRGSYPRVRVLSQPKPSKGTDTHLGMEATSSEDPKLEKDRSLYSQDH